MRARPSAEVNSVMMRPQPDCWLVTGGVDGADIPCRVGHGRRGFAVNRLALRMKRRKTVSVTPAMGARTVAGDVDVRRWDRRGDARACGHGVLDRVVPVLLHKTLFLLICFTEQLHCLISYACTKASALSGGLVVIPMAAITSLPAPLWRTCGGSARRGPRCRPASACR